MRFNKHGIKCLIGALFIMMAFGGCSKPSLKELEIAPSLMEEHPDSVVNMLEKFELPNDVSDSDKARYDLLLAEARYKNFIDEDNDSVIKACADYFLKNNEVENAAMSLFLCGIIQKNIGEMGESVVSFTRSLDLSRENDLFEIEGLASRGLYSLYLTLFDGANQIKFAKEAYEAFVKAGDIERADYAQLSLGVAYNNAGKYSDAISKAMDIINLSKENGDSVLESEANSLIGVANIALGKYKEAIYYYSKAYALDKNILSHNDKENIIIALSKINIDSLAPETFHLINDIEKQSDMYTPFEIYAKKGEYEKAYLNLLQYKAEQDSTLSSLLKSNVSAALANYEQSKHLIQHEKNKYERLCWIIVFLLGLMVSAAIIYLLFRNLREKERQREIIIKDAECIKTDLLFQIETNKLISGSIKELFKQKYSVVNALCSAYYESAGAKLEKKRIVAEVENLIRDFTEKSNRKIELVESADKYTDGIYSAFKKDFPKLKEEDYRLFLYLIFGFSARSISLFMEEKIEVIYNRKSRLKSKIKSSNVTLKNEYLEYCSVTG